MVACIAHYWMLDTGVIIQHPHNNKCTMNNCCYCLHVTAACKLPSNAQSIVSYWLTRRAGRSIVVYSSYLCCVCIYGMTRFSCVIYSGVPSGEIKILTNIILYHKCCFGIEVYDHQIEIKSPNHSPSRWSCNERKAWVSSTSPRYPM